MDAKAGVKMVELVSLHTPKYKDKGPLCQDRCRVT